MKSSDNQALSGDGVFIKYNQNLEPEKSNNINLGVLKRNCNTI